MDPLLGWSADRHLAVQLPTRSLYSFSVNVSEGLARGPHAFVMDLAWMAANGHCIEPEEAMDGVADTPRSRSLERKRVSSVK